MMFTKQKKKVTMGCDRMQKSKRFQDLSLWHRVVWLGLEFVCTRVVFLMSCRMFQSCFVAFRDMVMVVAFGRRHAGAIPARNGS